MPSFRTVSCIFTTKSDVDMSGCNGICLLLLVNSVSCVYGLMSLISFSQNARSYEVTEKYFYQGVSKYKKKYFAFS